MSVKLVIRVTPNAREFRIEPLADGSYRVSVPEPAERNRANIALIKHMSRVLGCEVRLVSGAGGRRKALEADIDAVALKERVEAAQKPKKA